MHMYWSSRMTLKVRLLEHLFYIHIDSGGLVYCDWHFCYAHYSVKSHFHCTVVLML